MARQMATMIGSGLSLLRTLSILADQTDNKKLSEILGHIRDDVETGVSSPTRSNWSGSISASGTTFRPGKASPSPAGRSSIARSGRP